MTWEALPSQLSPPQPPLPIEIAEEGREGSDDVEAEVWPPAGRGIQHIRIRVNRDAMLPYGARIDEVVSVDAGSVGQSLSFPSSHSVPSPPCLLYTSPSPRD